MSRLYIVILITLYVSRCKCQSRDSLDEWARPDTASRPPDYTEGAPPPDIESQPPDYTEGAPPPDIESQPPDYTEGAPLPDSMEPHEVEEDLPPYDPSLDATILPVYDEMRMLISDHAGAQYLGRVVDDKCGHTVDLYSKLNEAIKRQCHEYVTNHLHKLSRELECPDLHAMLTKHLAALHPHGRADDLSRA
eukprot:436260_1